MNTIGLAGAALAVAIVTATVTRSHSAEAGPKSERWYASVTVAGAGEDGKPLYWTPVVFPSEAACRAAVEDPNASTYNREFQRAYKELYLTKLVEHSGDPTFVFGAPVCVSVPVDAFALIGDMMDTMARVGFPGSARNPLH